MCWTSHRSLAAQNLFGIGGGRLIVAHVSHGEHLLLVVPLLVWHFWALFGLSLAAGNATQPGSLKHAVHGSGHSPAALF